VNCTEILDQFPENDVTASLEDFICMKHDENILEPINGESINGIDFDRCDSELSPTKDDCATSEIISDFIDSAEFTINIVSSYFDGN